jgi:hypothetical protein
MMIEISWEDLDEDVKALLTVSDVWEQPMARDIILDAIDPLPITALGPTFSFEDRKPLEVPHPCATVDLAEAWSEAQIDARACKALLEEDCSLEASMRAYRNTIRWLRFWSLRFPNELWREGFERQLEVRERGLRRLKDKAKFRFELGMMQALEAV